MAKTMDAITTAQKRLELRSLYERLAAHWGWPMPASWLDDLPTIKADLDNALICLRGLVADQCETLRNPERTVEV
jgi:hypothetical protein